MIEDIQFEVIKNPSKELCEAVNYPLRIHNQTFNPIFWEKADKEENQPKTLKIFAFDTEKNVVGGLFGTTQFSWLKIEILSIKTGFRKKGTGSSLLAFAEEIGRKRDCKYSFTETMDFQAPDFYKKYGYQIEGQLYDWDSHGHKKFFLVKNLLESSLGTEMELSRNTI